MENGAESVLFSGQTFGLKSFFALFLIYYNVIVNYNLPYKKVLP